MSRVERMVRYLGGFNYEWSCTRYIWNIGGWTRESWDEDHHKGDIIDFKTAAISEKLLPSKVTEEIERRCREKMLKDALDKELDYDTLEFPGQGSDEFHTGAVLDEAMLVKTTGLPYEDTKTINGIHWTITISLFILLVGVVLSGFVEIQKLRTINDVSIQDRIQIKKEQNKMRQEFEVRLRKLEE